MNLFGLILLAGLHFPACQSAHQNQPGQASADTTGTPGFIDGITDENRGAFRGPVMLEGTVQNAGWKTMRLYSTYGRTNTLIDSVDIKEMTFRFPERDLEVGFYMIGTADNNLCPIIINPKEKKLVIQVKGTKMDGGCVAPGSKENEGWLAYYPKENALLKQIREAKTAARKSTLKGEYEKQAAERENQLHNLRADMISRYPGTYFSKTLTWKQEPFPKDKEKYWNNIDFSDPSLIHNLVLSDRIQNYMRTFSGGEEKGFIECIGRITDKAKVNDLVLEFALNQMLIGFYESGMENISTYLIDNYVNGDACGDADLSNIIESTAESIARLGVGHSPPNISGRTMDGKTFDLMKTVAGKKYTLVMFWSSWCEHCQGEAPEVKNCYLQWKDKGFELIGYSVDTNELAWKKAVADREFSFPNLCGFKQWDSKAAKDYRITKTPGFFLLDQSGTIVLKPKSIREVQGFLKTHL